MDINKEREAFEKLPEINAILHNSEFGFNEGINQYYHPNHAEHRLSYAFLMGAWLAWQAKAQAVPEWISVDDELPSEGDLLLGISTTKLAKFNVYQVVALDEFDDCEITHWMHLPQAPKAQEQSHE